MFSGMCELGPQKRSVTTPPTTEKSVPPGGPAKKFSINSVKKTF